MLNWYNKLGFDLVPIVNNGKKPIEKDWTNKSHKEIGEWKSWLKTGINIGVKSGKISNVTILDVDVKPIPKNLQEIIGKPLIQESTNGYHLFYQYEPDLPKTRIDKLKMDIQNDGGQVVICPSIIDGVKRKWNSMNSPPLMPEELKKFLLTNITTSLVKTKEEIIKEEIKTEDFNINIIKEGNRHNIFMHLGGILRKSLNLNQTEEVLKILNHHFCEPPLSNYEFNKVTDSLSRYVGFDERDIAESVLRHFRIIEEGTAKDIKDALGFKKETLDKVIAYLVKEGLLLKRRSKFRVSTKAEWKDTWMEDGIKIDFKMPYFEDICVLRDGDMIVVGAKQKVGKSHIALNMIKQLVEQRKKPFYISLESGNRFVDIAQTLGLRESQFNWCVHFRPQDIEIEDNAVTIIDWLLPNDYAETDKLYQHFAKQLVKHKGILIIFVQLKDNGDFFAKNMISMFPALVVKYLYDNEDEGSTGYFWAEYIREAKFKGKKRKICCAYNWDTKELKIVE